MSNRGFFAYPSQPKQISQSVKAAISRHKMNHPSFDVTEWSQNEIAGAFITEPIFESIDESDLIFADITGLNFNVVFELGYAIGKRKRVILTRFSPIKEDQLIREVGLFDTVGYEQYSTEEALCTIIETIYTRRPLALVSTDVLERSSPVFLLLPSHVTDVESRVSSRIKKAKLRFRTYDPNEVGRLSMLTAIQEVAKSAAIVSTFQPSLYEGSKVHNTRIAFVAGVAFALEKTLVIVSPPNEDVALDFRDIVKPVADPESVDQHIAAMASEVTAKLQESNKLIRPRDLPGTLEKLELGASAAENELTELEHYFVKTDEYARLLRGEAQILSGRKGSGKTALFIQVRNRIRSTKGRLVLDLMPEGYQLLKFKEKVLDLLSEGAREHTVSAFWEYLLMLEDMQ